MEVRADTYLWAIRMYKSRTIAGEAIKGGKVKLDGSNFKPSHIVKIGETYSLTIGETKKVIVVVNLVDKRGSFEIAKQFYLDKSEPINNSEKLPSAFFKVNLKRDKGEGRPTKKDRRDLSDFGWNT
ncbi:MAG: RNA-binding S4 domain-containing protein [Bacteroidota bacterium]|jgi:ribosome-associated heat shock protein Hsp15|nr:RNA-binding S4 domain-containing protein [Bacteroidota bacterium]MCA6443818.1 RNA-binding S4 domain-containing protein [Bacteroidota bacterium]